jgi:hypothetical protein
MRSKYSAILILGFSSLFFSCKKQLNVANPNSPTPQSAATEVGITDLAQGGVYLNGFHNLKYSGDQLLPGYWGETVIYQSSMADEIWDEAANEYMNQLGAPFQVTLSNSTILPNPNAPQSEIALIRQINQNTYGYNNPLYYEWSYMYSLNNAMNNVLNVAANVKFTGDGPSKLATFQAWAYFWKGYAYSRIGSIYYAGILNSAVNPANLASGATNGNYVSHQAMVVAANACFDSAIAYVNGAAAGTLQSTLGSIVPGIFQVGLGKAMTSDMFIRNINTYKARNILVNNNLSSISAAQWDSVLTFANAGIQQGDYVFTARSDDNSTFMSSGGNLAAEATGDPNNTAAVTLSERLMQDFQPGDYRFNNNFSLSSSGTFTYPDRSEAGGIRYQLLDGNANGVAGDLALVLNPDSTAKYAGTVVISNTSVGGYELYLAGTFEENELMKAEALINTGNIDQGLTSVDNVRAYQGANLAPTSGTGLSLAQAVKQVYSERRVALMFRGLAFYDARRFGIIYPVANGGGRTGANLIDATGALQTNVTIDYNYLDYWDVPGNETAYNPASSGSAPINNPAQ